MISRFRKVLYPQSLKEECRSSTSAFTRDRKLPFHLVVLLILNALKGSVADELDQFFQALFKWDVAKRFVTKSAFSQARRKLSHRVFIKLLDQVCALANQQSDLATYKGLRVFAIDGSTMRLPDNLMVRERFGTTRNHNSQRAMGRVSLLFDVLNRITYDAILGEFHTGEISMAWDHLEETQLPQDHLILLDRGYYDFATLRNILNNGGHFCIRLRANLGIYKAFMRSGKDDVCLRLKPPKQNRKGFARESEFRQGFTVRVVRYRIGRTDYILMTSLLAADYTIGELGDLYHARWQVEESFKIKKCRLHIEQISGATPEIALQDFHARVLKEALTACLVLDCNEWLECTNRGKKYDYKICLTQALAKMKNALPLLCLRARPRRLIHDLLDVFRHSLISIEPGRSYPRNLPSNYGSKIQSFTFGYRPNR